MLRSRLYLMTILTVFAGLVLIFQFGVSQSQGQSSTQGGSVDLALVLAVDCSGSVKEDEFQLQMQGLATAFRDPKVIRALQSGRSHRIAVMLVQWSSENSQVIALPWTILSDAASANSFADTVTATQRLSADGSTSISGVITTSTALLINTPFTASRKVIDISGDGINNNGSIPEVARDLAVSLGITINGLPILHENAYLDQYYIESVIGGKGAFVEVANDFAAYPKAIKRKLLKEIKAEKIS